MKAVGIWKHMIYNLVNIQPSNSNLRCLVDDFVKTKEKRYLA